MQFRRSWIKKMCASRHASCRDILLTGRSGISLISVVKDAHCCTTACIFRKVAGSVHMGCLALLMTVTACS